MTGACAASFDLLQQTLLQLAVSEDQRGRAVGVWVLGIGSAPVGHLEMGSLIAVLGAPSALMINGLAVVVCALVSRSRCGDFKGSRVEKTLRGELARLGVRLIDNEVVSKVGPSCPTRFPTRTDAMPATPSIGEWICVYERFSCA